MIILTSFVLLVAAAQAGAQQKVPADPVVQVGIFSYRPDGGDQSSAYETNLSTETTVYVAGCAVGAGTRPAPDRATDAWRLSGKIVSATADEAVVDLDWQRIRADGAAVSSPGSSLQLTLHIGDRVPLDSMTRDATAECPARTIRFEARYVPRSASLAGVNGLVRGGGGSGEVAGEAGIASSTSSSHRSASGSGRAVHRYRPIEPAPASPAQFDVDLWLVRESPGRHDQTLYQALTGVRSSAQFAFAPVTIETARATVNLQVTGLLQIKTDEAGGRQLVFVTMRNAKFSSTAGTSRDPIPSVQGASTTTSPLPGPADVLSFEMPPLRLPNGGPAIPDQFSIRVRVR
jgi:hypothetical protein